MDVHRIPRLILGRGAAAPGRSFGARRHVNKKPMSTELTPIPHQSPDPPQQRAVPRKSVAFGYHVTKLCPRSPLRPGRAWLELPGQFSKAFPTVSRQTSPGTPVEMAGALACSGLASAFRAALWSMGTAGKVGNELRHRDPLGDVRSFQPQFDCRLLARRSGEADTGCVLTPYI
jgi:hypothetical protein